MTETRKLAAIMAIDVVGYSPLPHEAAIRVRNGAARSRESGDRVNNALP